MSSDRWVERWNVVSTSSGNTYTVAKDRDGNFGCSCPRWKFKREECKHIAQIKSALQQKAVARATPVVTEERKKDTWYI